MLRRLRTLRLKYRAIIYGCLVSYGVFFGGTIFVNMVAAAASADRAGLQVARQSPAFMAALFILGLVAPAAGGYLAARMSPRAELTHALAVGVVITILALFNPALFSNRPDLLGHPRHRADTPGSLHWRPPAAIPVGTFHRSRLVAAASHRRHTRVHSFQGATQLRVVQ